MVLNQAKIVIFRGFIFDNLLINNVKKALLYLVYHSEKIKNIYYTQHLIGKYFIYSFMKIFNY